MRMHVAAFQSLSLLYNIIHSIIDKFWGSQYFAIANNMAMNILVHVLWNKFAIMSRVHILQ